MTYTDVNLQSFACYILRVGFNVTNSSLTNIWLNALDSQLITDAEQSSEENFDYDMLAFVYLAETTSWTPSNTATNDTANLLSLPNLIAHASNLSNQAKAALAIALLEDSKNQKGYNQTINYLLNALQSNLRVEARTAYISFGGGNPNADNTASALALLAFVNARIENALVEKLANYVSQEHDESLIWYTWLSSQQIAYSLLSVSAYDQSKNNTNPNLNITVYSDNHVLLSGHFTSKTPPTLQKTVPFDQLNGSVSFAINGRGEASIVLGLSFIPLVPNQNPVNLGISVEKIIQIIDANTLNVGPAITSALIGEFLQVTIQITVYDDSDAIDIVDPLPGAFEALDTSIYTVPSQSTGPVGTGPIGTGPIVMGTTGTFSPIIIRNPFALVEFQQNQVIFHGQDVPAGSYEVSYTAIVTTLGLFWVPSTLASDVKQPEVLGLSSSFKFNTTSSTSSFSSTLSC